MKIKDTLQKAGDPNRKLSAEMLTYFVQILQRQPTVEEMKFIAKATEKLRPHYVIALEKLEQEIEKFDRTNDEIAK